MWGLEDRSLSVSTLESQHTLNSQYLGDVGEAGEVGEYLGDIGEPWAGAKGGKSSQKVVVKVPRWSVTYKSENLFGGSGK